MLAELLHIGLAIGLAAASAGEKPKGKELAVTDKPLTVQVESTAALRAGLAAACRPVPEAVVMLVLKGVVPPAPRDRVVGVRVFLNKDGAVWDTPVEDPHFVTAFAFPPTEQRDPYGLNLDLTRTVRSLARRGELDPAKPLRVTLVAIPARGAEGLPAGFAVPIGGLSVEVAPAR